ncbi:MAG: hypothetical protein KDB27_06465, partial [Planctomycetales bacterium]|nr:hypothetical protein [Planctomycetales bacterium]
MSPITRLGFVSITLFFGTLRTLSAQPLDSAVSSPSGRHAVIGEVVGESTEPYVPARGRTESDLDRVSAAASFAEGRLFYQRDQFGKALQKYQRAFRYSHAKEYLVEEIVPLAYRIGRYDEAFRYLVLASDNVSVDPFVVRRLAIAFSEQRQFAMAATLYNRILQDLDSRADTDKSGQAKTTRFITRFEAGRICYLLGHHEDAVRHFQPIASVLEGHDLGIEQDAVDAIRRQSATVHQVLAESFLSTNNFEKAKLYFRKLHAGNEPLLGFSLARVCFSAGELDDA